MSTSIDQRSKVQPNRVSNGPVSKEQDFDATYIQNPPPPQQGAYPTAAQMSTPTVTDHYMNNYYGPYMTFPGVGTGAGGDGAWSNGDPVSFLGGYGGPMAGDYMSAGAMFGGGGNTGFDYGQAANFAAAWNFPGGDYSAWGTNSAPLGREADERAYARGYYGMPPPADMYGAMNGGAIDAGLKSVEHGLKVVNLNDCPNEEQVAAAPKKMSWASVASQPARPQPTQRARNMPPVPVPRGGNGGSGKHNMDIGTWDGKNPKGANRSGGGSAAGGSWNSPRAGSSGNSRSTTGPYNSGGTLVTTVDNSSPPANNSPPLAQSAVLDRLRSANQYNSREFSLTSRGARYFVIKSYSEDDIHRSIKYSIWCSTEHGNRNLDGAFRERSGRGPIYLLFSVNGSGHFCGVAEMTSPLDYGQSSKVWAQDKWRGQFAVRWLYVKDVPNSQLRHIRLENNDNKPVTNSRDTQEILPADRGRQVLRIIHSYRHTTSIFDDFSHYERRQEGSDSNKEKEEIAEDGTEQEW